MNIPMDEIVSFTWGSSVGVIGKPMTLREALEAFGTLTDARQESARITPPRPISVSAGEDGLSELRANDIRRLIDAAWSR